MSSASSGLQCIVSEALTAEGFALSFKFSLEVLSRLEKPLSSYKHQGLTVAAVHSLRPCFAGV